MIEAYRIGVNIGMSGNVAKVIEQLVKQFGVLDKAIQRTQAEVNGLVSGMRVIAREGRAAADSWKQAATAMERAAKAARTATAGSAAAGAAAGGAASSGAAAAAAAGISARNGPRQSRPALPYYNPTLPAPYNGTQSFSQGRVYHGEIIPPSRSGGVSGLLPPPSGPTISGQAWRPGAASYGPYGGGGPGGGGGGGGAGGGGGGGGPGGGGALPPPGPGGIPLAPGPYVYPQGPNNYSYTPGKAANLGNGVTSGFIGWGGFEWMKENWKQAASLDEQQAGLLKQGFTSDEVSRARKLSFDLQQKLGTDVPTNMHIIEKLMTVTQDKNAALNEQVVEEYAKYQQTVNLRGGHGAGGGVADLDASIRAAEYTGRLIHKNPDTGKEEVSTEGLSSFIKLMMGAHVVSGGDIGSRQMLQYLRSSGGSGAFINDDELMRSMALQIALGSAKAGSALQGFEQQFTAGRMSEAAANLLIEMGVIGGGGTAKNNKNLQKMGIGQFLLLPGAMPENQQKMATEEPSQFITKYLLPKYEDYARKRFGKSYDDADPKTRMRMEGQVAQSVASRIPGATEQVEAIRNLLLMMRDVDAVKNRLKEDLYGINVANNPFVKTQATGSAYQGLQIGLGEATMTPVSEGLGKLAGALNSISTWSGEHSEMTKLGLEALAGGLAAIAAAGAVAVLTTLGGATGVLAAVGIGAVAMAAGITKLEAALKGWYPKFFLTDEQQAADKKKGVITPWWVPGSGTGGSEPAPEWFENLKEGLRHPLGPRKSNAPIAPNGAGPTNSDPMPVRITNPKDLTTGMAGGLSNQMNRPPSGVTGHDPTMDPMAAMFGAAP